MMNREPLDDIIGRAVFLLVAYNIPGQEDVAKARSTANTLEKDFKISSYPTVVVLRPATEDIFGFHYQVAMQCSGKPPGECAKEAASLIKSGQAN
jgi:hypothetical protein